MIAYEVPPPNCVGAKKINAPASATATRRPVAIPVTRLLLMATSEGMPGEASIRPARRSPIEPYEVAITDSWSAVVMAMSGLKLQVTLTPPVTGSSCTSSSR